MNTYSVDQKEILTISAPYNVEDIDKETSLSPYQYLRTSSSLFLELIIRMYGNVTL